MLCSCGPDKYPISFHMETGATDSRKFAFERDGHYYSKAPFISHKDIESYYSFPALDNTYGIVVNVRKGLDSRVEGITAANLGRQILPIVNGHAMQPLRLYSKPVTSGKLAIMGGFSPADLAPMAELIPPAGPNRVFRRRRKPKTLKNTRTVPWSAPAGGGSEPAPFISACTATPFHS